MLATSTARLAAHAAAAALVAAFVAAGGTITSDTAAPAAAPAAAEPIACDGSKGWATRYLGEHGDTFARSVLCLSVSQHLNSKGIANMITFHAAARKTSAGFVPMVTLRADKGRMVGSKVAQHGNTFETAEDAKAFALVSALRVAMAYPEFMTVSKA